MCLGSLPSRAQTMHRFTHPAMGTLFHLTIAAGDTSGLAAAVRAACDTIDLLEDTFSDYRDDSELSRLRGKAGIVPVSGHLYAILTISAKLSRDSGGAFDVTVGPLSKLWRRAFRRQVFPDSQQIIRARTQVQWKGVIPVAATSSVFLRAPGYQLDLGGVAKGYALDVIGKELINRGFPAFLLDGGGDLLLGAAPTGARGWVIAAADGSPLGEFERVAIATSGAEFQYLDWRGKRYSHVIDPRTGYGVTNPEPVTVFGPSAALADALASTYSVLGPGCPVAGYGAYRVRW